jgi:hypothetical protein
MADYTDIIARFADQLAAETLAKFIADAGVSCDVVDRGDVVSRTRSSRAQSSFQLSSA